MNEKQRQSLTDDIRARLRAKADPERARQAATFFPSKPPVLGTPGGFSREVGAEAARRLRAEGDLEDVVAVAEALYQSGVMEEGACANEMVGRFWRRFGPDDWDRFGRWLGWFTCWGTVDSFCVKVLSHLVVRDGPPTTRLACWARSEDVWHRRASLVSLVRAARVGLQVEEMFGLLDALLGDPEDMVQKAIGWMLKELCKGDIEATIRYLRGHRERMTRLALRYACERMTPEQKAAARTV